MPPVRKRRFTDDERRLRKNERERKRRALGKNGGEPDFIRMVKATDIPSTRPRRYGSRGGSCCFVIMRPGETVYFPPGTVHFVFRRRGDEQQTMAIGGHLLRFSDIVQWVETIKLQLRYPNATNEDLLSQVVSGYLDAVKRLVRIATTEMIESFGGEDGIAVFEQTTKVFSELCYLLPARALISLGMF